MDLRERIMAAAHSLLTEKPLDRITLADVARAANVSWPTVRRHIGSKEKLREMLSADGGAGVNPGTRARIIASAATIFARHGYAEASLDEVAAEAGLTKGAVYWHFSSKSDLYLALLEDRVRQEAAVLPSTIRQATSAPNPEDGLAELLARQFSVAYDEPERPRLSLEFASRSWDPAVRERLSAIYREAHHKLSVMIGGLQQAGVLAEDVDPFVLSVVMSALIDGLVRLWLIGPEWVDPKDWTPQLARILWRGVKR